MLNRPNWQAASPPVRQQMGLTDEPLIDLREAFRSLRRRWRWTASILGLAILACAVYIALTPQQYTAFSLLFFDVRVAHPFQQQQLAQSVDSHYVDSQVEILKSEDI